ncbi:Aste57867_18956 [Aphanomyces stellatus]|uniref:Aste57867_18956 protein n=1 Tax=Aphanomyces stellatus TaxID=120398 RepID=A0A485LBM6_9STRA|nr:hypothetical protein As57867_018892 [Aphanomyces stellatus]VFT95686.1 Aste57867_18956 [Aphanomyces stellatus]
MKEALSMFLGPLAVIVGLVFLTPLGALFGDTSSAVAAVVFTTCVLGLQFLVVQHSSTSTVRTTQQLHIRRKVQHAGSGLLVVAGTFYASSVQVVIVLGCSAVAFYIITYLRKQYKVVNTTYLHVFGPILRQHEIAHRLPGAFWFLLGSALSLAFFSKDVAQLSILHLSLGDPCASFFGITLGHHSHKLANGKTIAGVVGCFVVCLLTSIAFLALVDGPVAHGTTLATKGLVMVLAGLAGTLGEALSLGVDDNLSLPLVSGAAMSLIWHVLLL